MAQELCMVLITFLTMYNFFSCSLVAQTSTDCILGASALGKRKEKPEETGIKAAEMLLKSLEQNACVDEHIQDQLIVFMALAKGCSKIKMGTMTLHTETAIYITEQLAKVSTIKIIDKH